MVTVGRHPILWHIMKIYSHYGHNEFALALGYKAEVIKEYFLRFQAMQSDLFIDLKSGRTRMTEQDCPDWKLSLIDTGEHTLTGGRLLRLRPHLQDGTFMLTYGDGVANVNIEELLQFHKAHGRAATVTAVRPAARFGSIAFDGNRVTRFKEKVQSDEGWINGGFFVFEPKIFDLLTGDDCVLEGSPMEKLVEQQELMVFRHSGFWQCMDTQRDRQLLEEYWRDAEPPWKVWKGRDV